jgi:hypothetical protein
VVQAIERLLDDPDAAAAMGRRVREQCIRRYSWDAMEGILAGVLDDVMSRAPRTARRGLEPLPS